MDRVKRERSANFKIDERDLLITLVKKYSNIIENKQSDGATWKKKELAWALIEKEFNAQCGGTFRSSKTLRIKYEGLKRTVRKKSAALRSELYRTGGGPNTATPLDSTEMHLKTMISLSTDGLESIYDSDVLPVVQNEDSELKLSMEEYMVLPTISNELQQGGTFDIASKVDSINLDVPHINDEVISAEEPPLKKPNVSENEIANEKHLLSKESALEDMSCSSTPPSHKKWDVTSRRNLKTKRHPALIANTPDSRKEKFDILTEKKMELVQLQREILEAEFLEKKKEWEFNEKQRQWIEEEHMLKLAKLRKELNN